MLSDIPGNITSVKKREHGLDPSTILRLLEKLPDNSYLYFDRYIPSVALMGKLMSLKIDATASIMSYKITGLGFNDQRRITKWKENKSVWITSTAFARRPQTEVEGWNEMQIIAIACHVQLWLNHTMKTLEV